VWLREKLTDEERRHRRVVRRWVTPGRRYVQLSGPALVMARPRQWWFQWRLRRDSRRVSVDDLTFMLDQGWRESLVATWLIAAGRRTELRPRIERDMLGGVPCGYAWSYCPALACLGTEDDARILVAYLDQALLLPPEPEGYYTQCQPEALAVLTYLDQQLGTSHAARFLAPDGAWHRWAGSDENNLATLQDSIPADVALASGRDPGVRRKFTSG
jgi:hypothetical protein